MLRIGFPVLGGTDVARAAAFWTAALHLDVSTQWHSRMWRALSQSSCGSAHDPPDSAQISTAAAARYRRGVIAGTARFIVLRRPGVRSPGELCGLLLGWGECG